MMTRGARVASVLCAAALMACGEGSTQNKNSAASTQAAAPLTQVELGYTVGRHFAYACALALFGQEAEAASSYELAGTAAAMLGVVLPEAPKREDALLKLRDRTLFDAIQRTAGADPAWAFALAMTTTDASIGISIETNASKQLANVGVIAGKLAIPETEWRSQLDAAIKTPTKQNGDALAAAFDAHYRFSGRK
ncbi:MAG: hypothetical protein U0271_30385 [Polyangiaceae bacterium]